MLKILERINALHLSEEFKNCKGQFYIKRFNTTLILALDGAIPDVKTLIEFNKYFTQYIKNSNFQKYEMFLKKYKSNDIFLLAKQLITLYYPYECSISEDNRLVIDLNNSRSSKMDSNYITELLKNIGIEDVYKNVEFINCLNEENELNTYAKEYIKSGVSQTNNSNSFMAYKNMTPMFTELISLPKTMEELNNCMYPKVKIEGEIFELETRTVKKGLLHLFKITNYKESVMIKWFSKIECPFKVGDCVELIGILSYDDYSKQVIVNLINDTDVSKIEAQYKKEMSFENLFDEVELERCELHAHSTFSTQDGLCSVKDYFENAKKFGIKALAITDHENVQAYPDIEKYSKETGIKPIYGVELNVVDNENYKIFYKGDSIKNHIVGIDIETTGFSAIYDDIIEISAYKIIDNKQYEYSVLVKLNDYNKLSNKITELTSITKDMLKSEGITIQEALKGLVDFIDDGIIVAHNATFDVHFIQTKMNSILGMEKNYSFIDTLNFSRSVLNDGKMKRFGLDKVCKKLGIELTEHHRAVADAIACLNIYYALISKLQDIPLEDEKCPKQGVTYRTIKLTSKKQKEVFDNLISNNVLSDANILRQENNAKAGTNKVNLTIDLVLNESEENEVLNVLNQNASIKCLSAYRKNTFYTDNFENLNLLIKESEIIANAKITHMTLLLKNQQGLKQLYKLISLSNIQRITSKGNVLFLTDILNSEARENVLLGTSCANGWFKQVYEKGFKYSMPLSIFDYVEIQPKDTYLSIADGPYTKDYIKDCVLNIINKCKEEKKIIVATCDSHYLNPKLKEYRDVYINTLGVGGVLHPLRNVENTGMHVLYSTNHLIKKLKEDYGFDARFAKKIIIENPDKLNSKIDDNIKIVPDKLYTPNDDFLKDKVLDVVGHKVPSIKEEFINIVNEASKQYMIAGKLPGYIEKRLKKEMDSIIGHGFYIIYYIAYLLVKQSNKDGYVVGSRGSVGSSFVAYLMGITEVNALPPHYICPHCHYQIFKGLPDFVKTKTKVIDGRYRQAVESVDDGFDLKDDVCPICGKRLRRDGHDIPFETFLGFNGDKTPDIDLNFSGEYQAKAHNFCKEVFGEEHAFRAGTIATVASKTAESYLTKYYTEKHISVSKTEVGRRSRYLTDVKRTTGQHPGGIIVLPSNMSIYDFTPIQYPANRPQDWFTTHLDYNAIHENVLKMDILGHDDPTILKFLMDLVKENPDEYPFDNPKDIPINDTKIMSYLKDDENGKINSLGIPEFGTSFVKGMLKDIQPKNFAELVKVSGLSHGTDVWNTNAQELVNGTIDEFGKIPFKDVIGCRDDIMVQLLYRGLEPKKAFDIMEFVRKGKVQKEPEKWQNFKKIMEEHNVPKWYIWSCEKIKYMFPKAHAVAYVLSAMRIAWFKANKPLDFYQAYFSVRATVFDSKTIASNNIEIINSRIEEISNNKYATNVELDSIPYLETAKEMIEAGFTFAKPIINRSHGTKFLKLNNKCLLMPFSVLNGVGNVTATSVYENRNDTPYLDLNDLKKRGKADKKFVEALESLDALVF